MNLLRRLGALLVVAVGTVGAPIGLWIFGRSLIPTRAPSLAEVWTALTAADNGRILATALLLAGIIAWLVFLTAVLVDVTARLGHRPPLRIPGLRAPQTLASSLIGMILLGTLTLSGPAAAGNLPTLPNSTGLNTPAAVTAPAIAGFSTAAVHHTVTAPAPAHIQAVAPVAAAGPQWVVSKGDTLWEIAKASLGDPLRFPEISALNAGKIQPDGQVMRDEDWLRPGWVLTLPADATVAGITGPGATDSAGPTASVDVVVDAGDTLSAIAVDHDSTLAAVWTANQGRPQPGGAQLTDPDLIHPGWTITIPATAVATEPVTPDPPTPTADTTSPTQIPVPVATEPAAATSPDEPAAQPVTPAPAAVTPAPAAVTPPAVPPSSTTTGTTSAPGAPSARVPLGIPGPRRQGRQIPGSQVR